MKLIHSNAARSGFKVLLDGTSSQAAIMVLSPGQSSSDVPAEEHPWAEQWLLVLSGTGSARTKKRRVKLKAGSLLLIEKNEAHQVTNTGRSPLRTMNFYAPRAYRRDGELLR